jgi:hypothetical protein
MSNETLSREQRLQELLATYLQDIEAGKTPDREKLLTQHPDLADELSGFFAGQMEVAARPDDVELPRQRLQRCEDTVREP